jgi:5-methylcytosine-specific restriction endonuclease McrA
MLDLDSGGPGDGLMANKHWLRDELLRRDGNECFFCGKPMEDPTIEHLICRQFGGGNNLANLALAHRACNRTGGHLSVVEKVRLREAMRAEV